MDRCETSTSAGGPNVSRLLLGLVPASVLVGLLAGLVLVPSAHAFVIDMEGHAPPGGSTDELDYDPPDFGVSIQGPFKITVAHGHYWSATNTLIFAQSDIGGTASDWFLHDSDLPLKIEVDGGGSFSVVSFQAGEWVGYPSPSTTGNPIEVTGYVTGGGTITTTFVSDATPSDGVGPNVDFETFVFGPGWDDLVAIEFLVVPPDDDDRQFGYDNIVVDVLPPPPPCGCDGDLDTDGTVTAADQTVVASCIGAMPTLATDPCYSADLDCDGDVDAIDVGIVGCQLGAAPDPLCCDCVDAATAPATPTFSADSHGATMQSTTPPTFPIAGTYFNSGAQILTTGDGGVPGPNPVSPSDTTLTPGIVRDQVELGLMLIGYVDIDALSYGNDLALACDVYGPTLQFSVDEFTVGASTTTVGGLGGAGAQEVAADVLSYLGPIAPTTPGATIDAVLDVDGSRMGLVEPFYPPAVLYGDNLDAYDRETSRFDLAEVIYFSMDADNLDPLNYYVGGAAMEGYSGADVLKSVSGLVSLAIPAATLGLDLGGTDTDDLDALAFHDADESGGYTAGDVLLFSVRRGSAVVGTPDSLLGLGIEPGDVLTLPTSAGLPPSIFIPAERLGLSTVRTDAVAHGDELDAMDAVFLPEPGFGGLLTAGATILGAWAGRKRRDGKCASSASSRRE